MGIYQTLLSHKIIIFLSICLSQISLRTKTDTFTAKKSLNLSISAKIRAKQQLYVCTYESSKAEIYLTVFDIPSIPATDIPLCCAIWLGSNSICKDANLTNPVSVSKDNNLYAFYEYTNTD